MRLLRWFIRLFLLAILVLVIGIAFFPGQMLGKIVEVAGPKALGVSTSLGDASLGLRQGRILLEDLVVGNPEGFKTDSLFELGSVFVEVDLKSLFSDTIIVRQVLVKDPRVTMEGSLTGSNIKKLRKQLEEKSAGNEEEVPDEQPEEGVPAKKVIIEKFVMDGAKVNLSIKLMQGNSLVLPLPQIELKDLGKEKDMSLADMAVFILGSIDDVIIGTVKGSGKLIVAAGGLAFDAAGAVGGAAVDVVGGTAKVTGGAVVGIGKGAGSLVKGTANLVTGGDDSKKEDKAAAAEAKPAEELPAEDAAASDESSVPRAKSPKSLLP